MHRFAPTSAILDSVPESPAETMAAAAEQAVATGAERFDVALDYSIESIKEVDRILDRQHQQIPRGLSRLLQKSPPESAIQTSARIWGAYLGEVIRRQWGGEWSVAETGPYEGSFILSLFDGDFQMCPPAKAYKRLKNGSGDNIWTYLAALNQMLADRGGSC